MEDAFPSGRRTSEDGERGKAERGRARGGPDKSVTIAPAFRYLTDGRYTARKPLFSMEQYASILKKTQTQTVKVRRMGRESLITYRYELPCCHYKGAESLCLNTKKPLLLVRWPVLLIESLFNSVFLMLCRRNI